MKPSAKRAQRRYRYKQRLLNMVTKAFRLLEEPPLGVEFSLADKAALRVQLESLISELRRKYDDTDQ